MKFEEYKAEKRTALHPEGVISLTTGGWYFGIDKPDFEYAKILFDRSSGTVKFEKVDSREHIGIGYMRSQTRRGITTHTLKNIKFVESGIAPLGKYKAVDGQPYTYQFYMPSRKMATANRNYKRGERRLKAEKQGKKTIKVNPQKKIEVTSE